MLHGYPGLRARDIAALAIRAARGGDGDEDRWPSIRHMEYAGLTSGKFITHPHDPGVLLGDAGAVPKVDVDVVVSMCRMGSEILPAEHIEFWLIDDGPSANANLEFVIDDAARTVQTLRAEGKRVFLHCAEGMSRTPSIAARYSMLLGENPQDLSTLTYTLGGKPIPVNPNPQFWAAALRG